MLNDKIVQIIISNLKEYVSESNVKFIPSNNILKYVIEFKGYYIEICYFFIDDFYRIKIENKKNNILNSVSFLTKSKQFHKEIKRRIRKNNLKNTFPNHIIEFTYMIIEQMIETNSLDDFQLKYLPSLKFDGLFL